VLVLGGAALLAARARAQAPAPATGDGAPADLAPETGLNAPVDMSPEPDRPVANDMAEETEAPPDRTPPVGRLHNYLGLVAGVGVASRQYGPRGDDLGRLTATTGLGGVQARLSGYADRHPLNARVVRMTMPELMLVLDLGGTVARRDETAVREGQAPGRSGVAAGGSGLANIGVGFASPGRVGIYGKIFVGQRFSAHSNTDLEGAYFIASAGPSAGLRVAAQRRLTLLLGGGIDGVLGVQRLNRSRLIAQLAPIVDLGVYVQPRHDVYFGVVARGDIGVLGARHGGQRMHGRAAAEVVWKLVNAGRARFAGVLIAWEGQRVDAGAGHPQFAAGGERRAGQQWVLSGGVTF